MDNRCPIGVTSRTMSRDIVNGQQAGALHDARAIGKPATVKELSVRAIICGLGVAVVMGASYPYIVLKLGFGPNVSVVAAFFGYLALGIVFKDYNRWENNIVQTAGTAAAQTAFMCVLLAAFDMLAASQTVSLKLTLTPLQSFAWLTSAGLLGVLLAVPMRQHFVVDEKLTYADGLAAGETLIVLDGKGSDARLAARALAIGAISSAALMLMTEDARVLSWFSSVIAPYALMHYGVIGANFTKNDVLFWVMWPATALLVSSGLAALVLRWRILAKTFRNLSTARAGSEVFPLQWVAIGVAITGVALVIIQKISLGLEIWMTVAAIILSIPLMLVGLRVL